MLLLRCYTLFQLTPKNGIFLGFNTLYIVDLFIYFYTRFIHCNVTDYTIVMLITLLSVILTYP